MGKSCLDLSGKVAVVFGASSGLGKAISLGFAEHGADVVPTARRAGMLQEVSEQIKSLGRKTFVETANVGDRASIRRLRESVLTEFGRVDILVNAAGQTFRQPTLSVEDADWAALFETNLTGVLHTCQEFYAPLKV